MTCGVKRSKRPIEPEAVFGHIKYDNSFKRFHYRGRRLVKADFATIAVAHNIRKMISNGYVMPYLHVTIYEKRMTNLY